MKTVSYFHLLSRSKLSTPLEEIARFVSFCFAVLDAVDTSIL